MLPKCASQGELRRKQGHNQSYINNRNCIAGNKIDTHFLRPGEVRWGYSQISLGGFLLKRPGRPESARISWALLHEKTAHALFHTFCRDIPATPPCVLTRTGNLVMLKRRLARELAPAYGHICPARGSRSLKRFASKAQNGPLCPTSFVWKVAFSSKAYDFRHISH